MEASLGGDSKSFVAREAMERGHGHGACLVGSPHAKPQISRPTNYGGSACEAMNSGGLPSRLDLHAKP